MTRVRCPPSRRRSLFPIQNRRPSDACVTRLGCSRPSRTNVFVPLPLQHPHTVLCARAAPKLGSADTTGGRMTTTARTATDEVLVGSLEEVERSRPRVLAAGGRTI